MSDQVKEPMNNEAVTDHQGPVTDHRGPVEDFKGPVEGFKGKVTDHKGPVEDFKGKVTDDGSDARLCPVADCGKLLHRVKFMANGNSVNTDSYCVAHGPVGDPLKNQEAKKEKQETAQGN